MARSTSLRESLRVHTRDYSLLMVAAMFVIFGLAVSNSVIPNYHEQQTLSKRRAELQREVEEAKARNAARQSEINALEDPYYIAQWMIERYHWRRAPQAETATPGATVQIPR